MKQHPLLKQAEIAGMTLWMEDGRLRWKASVPPPPSLLLMLQACRQELVDSLREMSIFGALLASAEASAAAFSEREPDPVEAAERAAIFGQPL